MARIPISNDLIQIIGTYTTESLTWRVIPIFGLMAYRSQFWRYKLEAERRGLVAPKIPAGASWAIYYSLATRRYGGVLEEVTGDPDAITEVAFAGPVLNAAFGTQVGWLIADDGRVASRFTASDFVNWAPVRIPERPALIEVADSDTGFTADIVTERSTIYTVRDGGRSIGTPANLGIGDIVEIVGTAGGDIYLLTRDSVVWVRYGRKDRPVRYRSGVLSIVWIPGSPRVGSYLAFVNINGAVGPEDKVPTEITKPNRHVLPVIGREKSVFGVGVEGIRLFPLGFPSSSHLPVEVLSSIYFIHRGDTTNIRLYPNNKIGVIQDAGPERSTPGYAIYPSNPSEVPELFGTARYAAVITDPVDPTVQQIPGGSIVPISIAGVSPLSPVWGGSVFYALPSDISPPTLATQSLGGGPMAEDYNDPQAVADAGHESDQDYNDGVEEIESVTGDESGRLDRWGTFH